MKIENCKLQNEESRELRGRHPWLRTLFTLGFCTLFVGGCTVAFANGFGDSPPSLAQAKRDKIIGVAVAITGATISIGAAIRLYIVEKAPRK